MSNESVDITPTPRILRTLGDIPFEAWQCLAELADNSIDAYKEALLRGVTISNPRLDLLWSSEETSPGKREVVVRDNGPGMSLENLQNAAKAGYSSNDSVNNLGLFGMGFNIATARLGDETEFLSTIADSNEWVGIRISFEELIKSKKFSAPVIRKKKEAVSESGTMVIVRHLKPGVFTDLKKRETMIRRRLENIYATILVKNNIEMFVQGKQLRPYPHCVWGDMRYVVRKSTKVYAVQTIDRDLGETYFDLSRNRYMSYDESADFDNLLHEGGVLPNHIVKRSRRLQGWLGIQRYSDPSDFGIDFVRNGRKIMVCDKSLFYFENPETGTLIQEYPIELGSTVGGRIVGEVHVDYLIPTYQKNSFDTTDFAWRLTIDALRGAGPILPKTRKLLGYQDDNDSPLGRLVNAYRRQDPGTKCLALNNTTAKQFHAEFRNGNPDYDSDARWYKTAQETDRERGEGGVAPQVDPGSRASDDVDEFTPDDRTNVVVDGEVATEEQIVPPVTSSRDILIERSETNEALCGKYAYGSTPGFEVKARRVTGTTIRVNSQRVPCHLFTSGMEMDFFYDLTHPLLAEFSISPKQLMLQLLAEKFHLRDAGVSIQEAFFGLVENYLGEERINSSALEERAAAIVGSIREKLPRRLGHRLIKVLEVIREIDAEQEDLAKSLLDEAPQLLVAYQNKTSDAIHALSYVPDRTILRLIKSFPDEFLDGKMFNLPYTNIIMSSTEAGNERLRNLQLEKVISYFRDCLDLINIGVNPSKHELLRHAHTLTLLEGLLD